MATFIYNDGGRAAAGFRDTKSRGDCVTRAIAIATGLKYREVYDTLNELALNERPTKRTRGKRSNAERGVFRKNYDRYLKGMGWQFIATMGFGTGCKVHLRADELPAGTILARLSRHLCAVIDGVIHDTHDPSRGGTRCVYGYYVKVRP
jgi:hypothetical protein